MTNFKHIQSMSIDELAEWLDKNCSFGDSLWLNDFNEKYCSKCEAIKLQYEDAKEKLGLELFSYDLTTECAYCECHDHCRFFPEIKGIPNNKKIIEMWLIEEANK